MCMQMTNNNDYKQPNPRIDFGSKDWYKDLWAGMAEYKSYISGQIIEPRPADLVPAAYLEKLQEYLDAATEALEVDEMKASTFWTKIPHLPIPPARFEIAEIQSEIDRLWGRIDQAHERIKGCYEIGEGY